MARYFLRRIGHSLWLLLGVSALAFALMEIAPGEFFDELRLNPQVERDTVGRLRAQYGLDQPLALRYLHWLGAAVRGDFGYSLAYNVPTGLLLWGRARNTLLLTATSALLSWLIAVPLGVWSAARQNQWPDHSCSVMTSALLVTPNLLLALGLLFLAVQTGFLPAAGMVSVGFAELGLWGKAKDLATHLLLPATALVLGTLPILVRHTRAAMIEVLHSPFVRATRAHGIPYRRLLYRHALPAAANPLISLLGLTVAGLLSGSLLVEVVMSWPGLGPLLLEAILARDIHVVIGATLFSTVFLLAGNFLADLLLYALDPRIRVE